MSPLAIENGDAPMKRIVIAIALMMGLLSVIPAHAATPQNELFFYNNPTSSGTTIKAQVNIDHVATDPVTVGLVSAAPGTASVPESVTVPTGKKNVGFNITVATVSVTTKVLITASFQTGDIAREITINQPSVSSVSAPAKINGGYTVKGTIKLIGFAPEGGYTVNLESSSDVVSVPETVEVAAGQTTASFDITTSVVSSAKPVLLTASDDVRTVTKKVTVTPVGVAGVSLKKISIKGGASVVGTVKLTAAAVEPVVVTLTSSSGLVTVPASVTIPAGEKSATFTITTSTVEVKTTVTITAVGGGVTKTSKLTLTV